MLSTTVVTDQEGCEEGASSELVPNEVCEQISQAQKNGEYDMETETSAITV